MLQQGTVVFSQVFVCLRGVREDIPGTRSFLCLSFHRRVGYQRVGYLGGGGRVVRVLCYLGGRYLEGRVSKWVGYPGGRV